MWLLICALLMTHWVLAFTGSFEKSTTSDELVHLTGGFSYWKLHDFRLHPENGVVTQRWETIPAWLSGKFRFPDLRTDVWQNSHVWRVGYDFFYQEGNDYEWLLRSGRAMNALWGVALGLLVFLWSLHLFGKTGAFISLFFHTLSPTMLAHAGLATSDLCTAFFFLASVTTFWWHLHRIRLSTAILSGGVLGLALGVKYSAPLLPLMFLILILIKCGFRNTSKPDGHITTLLEMAPEFLGSLLVHAIVAFVVLWGLYGFRYLAANPALPLQENFIRPWEWISSNTGLPGRVIHSCRSIHLLPEAWLYGMDYVLETTQQRGAFLDGAYSIHGWPQFFPLTFLYKTTSAVLAAIPLAGLVLVAVRGQAGQPGSAQIRSSMYRASPLMVLFSVYWILSIKSHLNIGHRHILPTYPIVFIFLGAPGLAIDSRKWVLGSGVVLVMVAQLVASISIRPDYLAYFNQLSGGPQMGYQHLVDSSLDWGQDLPGLSRWLLAKGSPRPVYLSYFGAGDPSSYGINAINMEGIGPMGITHPWYWLDAGTYCFSATMLQEVYSDYNGPWTQEREKQYQQLRKTDSLFRQYDEDAEKRHALEKEITPAQWNLAWLTFGQLRYARLCTYLRVRKPDAMIGYSILIFNLSAKELSAVIDGDIRAFADAIEKASGTRINDEKTSGESNQTKSSSVTANRD